MSSFAVLALASLLVAGCAQLERFQHPPKSDASLAVLVVGDWGRRGAYNQSQVASQMGIIGEKLDIDFVISTGDNFYDDGLTGVDDPAFEESFSNIYTAPALQKQWYNVLGNHDYRGDVEAQLSPVLRQKDRRWVCLRSFIVDAGAIMLPISSLLLTPLIHTCSMRSSFFALHAEIAEFFFVDTTPFVDKYFHASDHSYDWRGILPRNKYLSNLLKDVDLALKESTAKWRIVVGHHTMKSAGHHGNTKEINSLLLPVLEANNVDLYINGHDHCLEHISSRSSGLEFLTSGGGSKSWRGDVGWWNPEEMRFYYDGQGFMSLGITPTHVFLQFYDVHGTVLHKWAASKDLYSSL